MKIAILWSSGFIGRYITENLKREYDIIAFWRADSPFNSDIEYYTWDIRQANPYNLTFDICIDLAADVDYEKDQKNLLANNVDSMKYICEFLENSRCSHMIYISSSSVYMGKSGIIDEGVKISIDDLKNSYALSKYLAEVSLLEKISDSIKLSILRPRGVYGEEDTTLLPKILKYHILGNLILPWDGKVMTSMTSIENLAEAIRIIIHKQTSRSEIFNVSDEWEIAYEAMYRNLCVKYRFRWIFSLPVSILRVLMVFSPNKWSYIYDNFTRNKVLDISKIRKLWYNPLWSIESFLRK